MAVVCTGGRSDGIFQERFVAIQYRKPATKPAVFKVSLNRFLHKTRHYGRHNVIYGKARYSHDNSLGQAVPGTVNLAN